ETPERVGVLELAGVVDRVPGRAVVVVPLDRVAVRRCRHALSCREGLSPGEPPFRFRFLAPIADPAARRGDSLLRTRIEGAATRGALTNVEILRTAIKEVKGVKGGRVGDRARGPRTRRRKLAQIGTLDAWNDMASKGHAEKRPESHANNTPVRAPMLRRRGTDRRTLTLSTPTTDLDSSVRKMSFFSKLAVRGLGRAVGRLRARRSRRRRRGLGQAGLGGPPHQGPARHRRRRGGTWRDAAVDD
ncbi:hypothetical protein THAOC_08379, partial [Thalassiosira oceanica]